MEENRHVSVASSIYSINILVHGNVKLGGKKEHNLVCNITLSSPSTRLQIISRQLVERQNLDQTDQLPFAMLEYKLLSRDSRIG